MPGIGFGQAIAMIRVLMGGFFAWEALSQLADGWIGGDGLTRKLTTSLAENDIPGPYRWFLENVVLEWDGAFTVVTIAGEAAVAALLILGLMTRGAALLAIFMNANFMLMNGIVTDGGIVDMIFIAGELFVLIVASRQAWSADGVLARLGLRGMWMSGGIGHHEEAPPAAVEGS